MSEQGLAEDIHNATVMMQLYEKVNQVQFNNLARLEKHEFAAMVNNADKTNLTQEFLKKIDEMDAMINQQMITPAIKTTQDAVNKAIVQSSAFISWCIIIMLLAIYWSRKYVINKINQLLVYQSAIAKGDLSVPIHVAGSNEIDNLTKGLADMQDSLSEMISSVRSGAGNIYTSVQEISFGNNDLSKRTEEQASALEETAASMEQLTSSVKNNTESARQIAALVADSETKSRRGGELTHKMVKTMELITQSSHKINEIISVIDGIAFQTNILALNAAVEAARAGTHGQGFAVVAAEVRSLALRSAEAAKEIKMLIDTSVSHVRSGNVLTGEVDQAIRQIMDTSVNARVALEEIFRASEEQSQGIGQVSQAVSEMDTVTQQNAALVEQSAAASASLEEQVKRLNQIVNFFKVGQADDDTIPASPEMQHHGALAYHGG